MSTELSIVVMGGVVLSLFLIVGEIAALRKRARRVRARIGALYAARSFLRLTLALGAIAAFILAQPLIIALLIAMVMDGINPDFSHELVRQLRSAL